MQVAIERIKEYSDLVREPPEFVDPRPATNWPNEGSVNVKALSIRYAVRTRVYTLSNVC